MKTLSISTRIDEATNIAFTQVCHDVGLSPSQAMQLFAKAVVNYGGIPFELKVRQPHIQSTDTVRELQAGLEHIANNFCEPLKNANASTDEKVVSAQPYHKRSQLHPVLSNIQLNYDPTEPLSADEWQMADL